MKTKKSGRIAAAALAMAMCVPGTGFAAENDPSGSFDTSFDIYSPTLTLQVPVNLDIKVNPVADNTVTDVNRFEVASQSIDIWNGSVDKDADVGIPVNVTINASITEKKDEVITEYNTFTPDITSTNKKINLMLTEGKDIELQGKASGTPAYTTDNKLDLSQYELKTKAAYDAPDNEAAITKYGSLLSIDIDKPALASGATSYSDATKVTPIAGAFAVTGKANTSADWKGDDIKVAVSYSVKASKPRNIGQVTLTPVTWTSGTTATDLSITVPGVGEATVLGIGFHNDNVYGDYLMEEGKLEEGKYKVEYVANAGATDAKITVAKNNAALEFLAGDDTKSKPQDLIIALSDGRYVVSTFTAN